MFLRFTFLSCIINLIYSVQLVLSHETINVTHSVTQTKLVWRYKDNQRDGVNGFRSKIESLPCWNTWWRCYKTFLDRHWLCWTISWSVWLGLVILGWSLHDWNILWYPTLYLGSGFNKKWLTSLNKFVRDKHSSLFWVSVSDRSVFIFLPPEPNVIKLFMSIFYKCL